MLIALVPTEGRWLGQFLDDDGHPVAGDEQVLAAPLSAAEIAELEALHRPRWLWSDTSLIYSGLLASGVRLDRCHDVAMTERLLLARDSRYGEPVAPAAVVARRTGQPVPADSVVLPPSAPTLFDTQADDPAENLRLLPAAYRDQARRIPHLAADPHNLGIAVPPGALKLLVAADSAAALVAAEMGFLGLPWRIGVHEQILTERLGPRAPTGERPSKMAALAAEINIAFGFSVNPDSAVDLRNAFRRAGFEIETTRSWVIRELDHPAVRPVLAYKELSRLLTANGWNWLAEWVRDGRFHTDYVSAGVITGRWATRGGGGLQIPKTVRSAVIADPGYVLVVADAAQLEPRVLVAVSGDSRLGELAADDDLYVGLARIGFSGDRDKAKLAMLGAMYGQTSGEAGQLVATLRATFPAAMGCVETAAHRGEQGKLVATVLGRTCNPPSEAWTEIVDAGSAPQATAAQERRARQVARDRGRFTRNFIIQGAAADWAAVWLSTLRQSMRSLPAAELVFFQHDELIVHCPVDQAEDIAQLVSQAADVATQLVFPGGSTRIPVRPTIVECYADAK